jgi:hypothetical protein
MEVTELLNRMGLEKQKLDERKMPDSPSCFKKNGVRVMDTKDKKCITQICIEQR